MAATALALAVGFMLMNSTTPRKSSPDNFTTSREADLPTIAQSALASVQLGRVESLYLLLSAPARTNTPLTALESSFAGWLPTVTANGDLRSRKVISVDQAAGTATIGRADDAFDSHGETKNWIWYFVREDSGWKIARFEGGPPIGDLSNR